MDPPHGDSKARVAEEASLRPLKSLWRWTKENADQIKIAFAVVAASYGLIEYKAKDYLERVKNSAEIIEGFYDSEAYNALVRLDDYWLSRAEQRQQIADGKLDPQEFRRQITREVQAHHRGDLLKAIRGLKSVSICTLQGRCNAASLCMHLAQSIQDLRCNFRDYIVELSEQNGSCIIDEINYFVDAKCASWMGSYLGVEKYTGIKDNFCLFDIKRKISKIGDKCVESIVYKERIGFFSRFVD